jgi:hypothetical protein
MDENIDETPVEVTQTHLEISDLKLAAQTNGKNSDLKKNGHSDLNMTNGETKRVLQNGNESYAKYNRSSSLTKAEWVRLNIGGKEFVTTKTTLCKNAQSFFYKLCQDDPAVGLTTDKDESGAFLIDRDPRYFAPILNYLRHGKLIIEGGLQEEGVLEEAEFYNIQDLIHLVKERIKERNQQRQSQQNVKRVYRVIQFKESEITQMMSTMSDGWRFEQIVNVGSHYNYTTEDHSEYLLIVSKEYDANDHMNDKASSDKRKKIFNQNV